MNTTEAQRAVLRALARKDEWAASLDVLAHDRKRTAGPFLGEFRTSRQVGARLGQLVRMGLAERRTHYGVGQYRITPAGREVAGIPEPDPRQPGRPAEIGSAQYLAQLASAERMTREMIKRTQAMAEDLRSQGFSAEFDSEGTLIIKVPGVRVEQPAGGKLEWHPGKHGWETHGDYRRHAHSINGQLTIDPADPRVHFSGGLPFRN